MAKDRLGHGSNGRGVSAVQARNDRMFAMFETARKQGVTGLYSGPPAHQAGVEDATKGKELNPSVAKAVLQKTGSLDKDYHTLSSGTTNDLSNYAKQYGYRKPASANGSTGRYFHSYLHKVAAKG